MLDFVIDDVDADLDAVGVVFATLGAVVLDAVGVVFATLDAVVLDAVGVVFATLDAVALDAAGVVFATLDADLDAVGVVFATLDAVALDKVGVDCTLEMRLDNFKETVLGEVGEKASDNKETRDDSNRSSLGHLYNKDTSLIRTPL